MSNGREREEESSVLLLEETLFDESEGEVITQTVAPNARPGGRQESTSHYHQSRAFANTRVARRDGSLASPGRCDVEASLADSRLRLGLSRSRLNGVEDRVSIDSTRRLLRTLDRAVYRGNAHRTTGPAVTRETGRDDNETSRDEGFRLSVLALST